MAKEKPALTKSGVPKTTFSTAANQNFRARIIYKSGASQDFLIVASSTTCFEEMRKAYLKYLSAGTPSSGFYVLYPGSVIVDWREVSSFHEWID